MENALRDTDAPLSNTTKTMLAHAMRRSKHEHKTKDILDESLCVVCSNFSWHFLQIYLSHINNNYDLLYGRQMSFNAYLAQSCN